MKERVEGEKKGWKRVGEGLEGEDFPGKFRETPRPPDPTRTSFAKSHWRGAKLRPFSGPLPLAYAHMRGDGAFYPPSRVF